MGKRDEEKTSQGIKTPLSVMLDMAKNEVGSSVFSCMEANRIPPVLMVYVVKDILLDIYQMRAEQMSNEYVELQKSVSREQMKDVEG